MRGPDSYRGVSVNLTFLKMKITFFKNQKQAIFYIRLKFTIPYIFKEFNNQKEQKRGARLIYALEPRDSVNIDNPLSFLLRFRSVL